MSKRVIPTNAEELVELLNDDAARGEIFGDAEATKEFIANYTKATNKGSDISKQISAQVSATLADLLKESGVTDRPDQTDVDAVASRLLAKPGTGAENNAAYNPTAPGAPLDGVVGDLGSFARLINSKMVKNAEQRAAFGKIEDLRNAYSSNDPASAGFLIPEEMRSDILQLSLENAIVRPRATVITMQSLTQKIPYVDSTTHVGSVFGGMVFYWTEESGLIINTEGKFGRVVLEAQKLTGGARVPNELWADAPALSSWLMAAVPSGLAYFEDVAFIEGSGVGEPLGFLNSGAVVAATRATSSKIESGDIYGMYARMLPQSLGRAVWIANQETLPQLLSLSHVIENVAGTENVGGSAAGIVQYGNISGAPTMSILGRPLIITEKVPALGSAGDLNFVDLSQYLVGDRQAISLDASEHSRFAYDETELRIIERVDGRPWIQSAITPKNGTATLSPFVSLAA
jgi:HK97 family phage major capsid protein